MSTTTSNAPKHIVDAIRQGRVSLHAARRFPRLHALVQQVRADDAPKRKQYKVVWLHPAKKGQRFQLHEEDKTGVITGWDRNRVSFFYTDDPNAVKSLRRDEFTEDMAHWLPSIHVWPTPSARNIADAPKIPEALVASITPEKVAA